MPDRIKEIENELLIRIPPVSRKIREPGYLTAANDGNEQLNEPYFYTIKGSRLQSVLSNPIEEVGLAPEQEIDNEWATIAKLSRERWSKENPY